ncbi:GyrI-like domain-containing protein [Agrococcus sp. ARC_14]|uniref:GyrI-like domain-containing protein n=1 Tax=Agrococcus sp. ARC_14 TaxID=2919927 RepID=UPI001F0601D8|nr:GyrI-like domain-containing protein [Agrococcus sp. ARC_14]MCH1884395.1 GyrI-like domain-containing protein [Agrococcus sp. ARC_14]
MAGKVDLKRTLDSYRAKPGEFRVIDVPAMQYLALDGHGDPNAAPAYRQALEALYPLAYALKFASKRELGRDYVVMPLEGLWWADDATAFTTARDKTQWSWTLLMLVPDWIGAPLVEQAADAVRAKGAPARLDEIRLETLDEGRCVQTLHIGSFDDEGPVLARMHDDFIPAQGLQMTGLHHEIYLSDARRVEPTRLRTILRQPVGSASESMTT